MNIPYFIADPAEVINARLSLNGADINDESCFVEMVTNLDELIDEVYRGTVVGKSEVLKYIYESNGTQWSDLARKLQDLDCGNKR